MANVFTKKKKLTMESYLNYDGDGRSNMGDDIPVLVYRMMEYALKEELIETYGKETQIKIFQNAGYRSGEYFAKNILDTSLDLNAFIAQLQQKMEEMKIGILRIEKFDESTGKIILTVSEDADCSGLPLLGETVCNYDEGFLAGVLSTYLGKKYEAEEIDCWATGDRVCRFCAEPEENRE